MLPGAPWPWCHADVPAQVLVQQAQWGEDLKARALGNEEGLFVSGGSQGGTAGSGGSRRRMCSRSGEEARQWWLTQTVMAAWTLEAAGGRGKQWEVLGQEGA